jgi:hypothetical protein
MAAPMKSNDEMLTEIIATLNENQKEYLLHLAKALFCQAAD